MSSAKRQTGCTQVAVILLLLFAALWLGGCSILRSAESGGGSEPPSLEEPPSGGNSSSTPRRATNTPQAGNDQPVSPNSQPTVSRAARPKITGHVLTTTQMPIEGAVVFITAGTAAYPERTYLTDAAGVYNITVPVGRYKVGVNAEGFKMVEKEVELTAQQDAILDFELEKE